MREPRSLSPPGSPAHYLPVPSATYHTAWYGPEEAEESFVPLAHYLWILKRQGWKILGFVAASLVCTFVVSKRLTPIYESTVTIDIDRRMPTGVIGQESQVSAVNDADQFLATQVKLVQSDSVIRPVVQQYRLREAEEQRAQVPPELQARARETPVVLKNLSVRRPPSTFLLLVSYRSADPDLAANVANGIARSYLEHTYEIRYRATASLSTFMEKQLEELRAKMERSGAALAEFEKDLSVVNPDQKTSVLSARLLQLNSDYTTAETERVKKEAVWNSARTGTIESLQVSGQADSLQRIRERLNEASQKFAEIKSHQGPNHPDYRKAAAEVAEVENQFQEARENIARRVETDYREALNREAMLRKAVAQTKAEFDQLNARSYEYQNLKHEAEADKGLYEELMRKIKEAGINAGFQNSSIRIADPARPDLIPISPNIRLNLILAFLFSTLLSVGAALLTDVMDNTIRDPEQARVMLGAEVMGTLPMVKPWRGKLVKAGESAEPGWTTTELNRSELSVVRESSGFQEAVRTLRNSILLTTFDRPVKNLMVTSSAPAEGKTTIAVHLAIAHAQQKHQTLLIDGDLRRPSVHAHFGSKPESGLDHALMNGLEWRDKLLRPTGVPGLHVLPAGPSSRRCADLIGAALKRILTEAETEYDLVIVDAPPVPGFPEPLQMATVVDGVVLVTIAGETNRKAVKSTLGTLRRLRANVLGLVLNKMTADISDGYYYDGYYGKYYK